MKPNRKKAVVSDPNKQEMQSEKAAFIFSAKAAFLSQTNYLH